MDTCVPRSGRADSLSLLVCDLAVAANSSYRWREASPSPFIDDRSKILISTSHAVGNTAEFQPLMPVEEALNLRGALYSQIIGHLARRLRQIFVLQRSLNYSRTPISECRLLKSRLSELTTQQKNKWPLPNVLTNATGLFDTIKPFSFVNSNSRFCPDRLLCGAIVR